MSNKAIKQPRVMTEEERLEAAERARFEKDRELEVNIDRHSSAIIHLMAKRYPRLVKSVAEKIH